MQINSASQHGGQARARLTPPHSLAKSATGRAVGPQRLRRLTHPTLHHHSNTMAAEDDAGDAETGAPPSPPAFSVLHDKPLAVDQVALCPKMDLAAVLMADGKSAACMNECLSIDQSIDLNNPRITIIRGCRLPVRRAHHLVAAPPRHPRLGAPGRAPRHGPGLEPRRQCGGAGPRTWRTEHVGHRCGGAGAASDRLSAGHVREVWCISEFFLNARRCLIIHPPIHPYIDLRPQK